MQQSQSEAGMFWKRLVQGLLIGVGGILPGISGGVLCVTFGLYQPMMAVLAHPIRNLPRYVRMFVPVVLGGAVGFLSVARLISGFFSSASALAVSLFAGLILGTVPGLYRSAGARGRSWRSFSAMVVSFFLMLAFFLVLTFARGVELRPTPGWMFFSGVLWGLSVVVPGMTSAATLIFLGLYQPMADGIAALDPGVLVPMGLGILITVLGLARVADRLFETHYAFAHHAVLGVVLASTLAILPRQVRSGWELGGCLLLGAAGFAAALAADRKQNKGLTK